MCDTLQRHIVNQVTKDEMNEFKTILNTNLDIKPFKLTQPRPRSIPVPEKVSSGLETVFTVYFICL